MTLQIGAVEIRAPVGKPNPTAVSRQPAVRLESTQRVEVTPPAAEASPVIAPKDQAEIIATASHGVKSGEARSALFKLIAMQETAKDAQGKRALENQLRILEKSKNPADRTLALDFKIAQQQIRLAGIESKIGEYRKALSETGMTAEVTKLYETTIKQLELQRDGVKDEQGAVKEEGMADVISRLNVEREKIPGNPPKAFYELAKQFGFSAEDADSNPLGAIQARLQEQTGNKKGDAAFFKELKDKGFAKDEIDGTANVLRVMRGEPTKIEKTGKIVAMGGGFMAALSLIIMWTATKEKQGAGAMG